MLAEKKELLGTIVEIKLLNSTFFNICFEEIERIEKTYSRFLKDSELTRLNCSLKSWQAISNEFIFLIEKGINLNKETDGNFDITLKSTLDSIGYDAEYSFKPKNVSSSLIKKIKEKTQKPILIKQNKVFVRKQIEFGGFGKGYALDQVASLLERKKVKKYYLNAGGDIYAKGDWTILLEHPDDPSRVIGQIKLDGMALASSAPNRRKWGQYHHLINAKTKMPVNTIKTVFVLSKKAIDADAYATALFTAGFEKAIELSKKLPAEALIVSKDNKMYISKGFDAEIYE
jgi:FAD:protein FMN transferase